MTEQQKNRIHYPALPSTVRQMAKACGMAIAVISAGYAPFAAADNFTLDNGDQGQWLAGISVGNAWRTSNPDPRLYSPVYSSNGARGLAGDGNQVGDLNYGKGAPISTPVTLTGEVQMKHDNIGFVVGARAWYDYTLENGKVPIGNANNGYIANSKLSDEGFYSESKFKGVALTNAYVFGTFEPIEDKPLKVKLGDQVVNWGESLFIPGINQFGAFNYQALVTPGATIKDALLPIPQIDVNWGLGGGLSVEAFYQFQSVKSVLPGCGTYWSISDIYNCNNASGPLLGDSTGVSQYAQLNGLTPLNGLMTAIGMPNYHPSFAATAQPEQAAKNSGQFGLSSHYYVDSISTDFGLYGAAYRSHLPALDLYKIGNPNTQSFYSGTFNGMPAAALLLKAGALMAMGTPASKAAAATLGGLYPLITPMSAGWDYSAPIIKELGLSASTELGGWSLAGEANYTKGVAVQLNPGDMIVGDLMGNLPAILGPSAAALKANSGPLSSWAGAPLGSVLKGFDLHNKTQLQMNTSKIFSQIAGAESLTLIGEIGAQKWSGIGDPNIPGTLRYGRGFVYGFAAANGTPTGAAVCKQLNAGAAQGYCNNAGFDTSTAWGYRASAELSYPNVIGGWNLTPRIYWAQDVHGYSADSVFIQDRDVLGLGLRTDYNNRYYAQITFTAFNHNAAYDTLHDRDNVSVVAGINF